MLNSILNSTSLPLLEKAAVFSERRQSVLAGNIANIATPNYRTRDLPVEKFEQAMKKAIADRQLPAGNKLSTMSLSLPVAPPGAATEPAVSRSIDDYFSDDLFKATDEQAKNLTYHDRGNRSIEHEVMEMTKNSMMQRYIVELMSAQMNLLQAVISERA